MKMDQTKDNLENLDYRMRLDNVNDIIYYVYRVWKNGEHQKWYTATMNIDQSDWTATLRRTADLVNTGSRMLQQIVNSTIYYTWIEKDTTYEKGQIWTAIMGTNGIGWTATQRTSDTGAFGVRNKGELDFEIYEGNIYFVYEESDSGYLDQIWTAKMTISGADWTAYKRTTALGNYEPQLSVSGSYVYYIYWDSGDNLKTVKLSITEGAGTWSPTVRDTTGYSYARPQIQVVGDTIYYFYEKHPNTSDDYLYRATMSTSETGWSATEIKHVHYPGKRLGNLHFNIDSADKRQYTWSEDDDAGSPGPYDQIWIGGDLLEWLTIETNETTNIKGTYCTGNGDITNGGQSNITERGFKFGESEEAQFCVRQTGTDLGTGAFSLTIDGLKPETTYYYMAFATNLEGTAYGDWVSFTTAASPSYGIYEEANVATICFYVRRAGGKWSIKHGPYTTDQDDIEIGKILTEGKGKYQIKFTSDVLTGLSISVMIKMDIKART